MHAGRQYKASQSKSHRLCVHTRKIELEYAEHDYQALQTNRIYVMATYDHVDYIHHAGRRFTASHKMKGKLMPMHHFCTFAIGINAFLGKLPYQKFSRQQ